MDIVVDTGKNYQELNEAEKIRLLINSESGERIPRTTISIPTTERCFSKKIISINPNEISVIHNIRFYDCKIIVNTFVTFIECAFENVNFVSASDLKFSMIFKKCSLGFLMFSPSLCMHELDLEECVFDVIYKINFKNVSIDRIYLINNACLNSGNLYIDLNTKNIQDTHIYYAEGTGNIFPKNCVRVSWIGSRNANTLYDYANDVVHCGCWNGVPTSEAFFEENLDCKHNYTLSQIREIAEKHNIIISRSLDSFKQRVTAEYHKPYDTILMHYYNQYMAAIAYFKAMREMYLKETNEKANYK